MGNMKPKQNFNNSFETGSIRDKLNLQYNVHKHMDRMSAIISDANLNENHYNWAIEHLLSMLRPYGDDDEKFKSALEEILDYYEGKKNKKGFREGGKIKNAETNQKMNELIREKNRHIFNELNYLIKRLRLGLETEVTEDIGG